MPILPIRNVKIDYLFKRFEIHSCSFIIGSDISISFTSSNFFNVIGLPHIGQQVDLDLKMNSRFLGRHFGEKLNNAD